jgi:hypothetical protein
LAAGNNFDAGDPADPELPGRSKIMKSRNITIRFSKAAITLLSLLGLMASASQAKSREKKQPQSGETVGIYLVSRLPLQNTIVGDIAPVSDPDRQLIQLTDDVHGTVTVVDVGTATHPKLREQFRIPAEVARSFVEVRMGDSTLLTAPEGVTSRQDDPQSVTLISFADPSNPKDVQKFENVTALWIDRGRELVYLTNGDGLWILKIYSDDDKQVQEHLEHSLYQVQ